ncbi:MAG: cytochrome c peroxidase [Pseudomonadota bacterium]|nr:cytochrome c peroxidase [Pseudomonadota bacterium]
MLLLLLACAGPDGWTEQERAAILSLSPVPAPAPSPTNRVADDPAAAKLGEALFFDEGLSIDGQTSCGSCHLPKLHFSDGERVATALGTGTRNTPSVESVGWGTWYFWDGRIDSAWAQAAGPLLNPLEMGATPEHVQARVRAAYADEFAKVFGGVAEEPTATLAQVGKALEAYERTLGPKPARFDRYAADLLAGTDSDVLSDQEKAGLRLFVGEASCTSCHHGPLFTDHSFHNLGLPAIPAGGIDPGRARGAGDVGVDPLNCRSGHADRAGAAAATDTAAPGAQLDTAAPGAPGGPTAQADTARSKDTAAPAPSGVSAADDPCPELRYLDASFPDWASAFKTPSLRNVAATAPYMHDGQLDSLGAVLQFYNTLPGKPLVGHRELTLEPLQLSSSELAALEAFLRTLTAEAPPAAP